MRATIKNTSPALQGVHTADEGLVWIEPGSQRTLTIHEDHVERTKRSKLLKVVEKTDHDGDGAMGGSVPTTSPKPFDDMTDDELRAFITDRDGSAPHHATGRAKLLAKARGED